MMPKQTAMMKNNIYIVVKIIILFCSMCGYPLAHLHAQNLIINSTTFDTGQHSYFSPGIITSPDSPAKPVQVTGNANVEYKAAQYVHLGCGFSTSLSGCGTFHAYTGNQPQECPTAIISLADEFCGGSLLTAAASINNFGTITAYQWQLNGYKIQGATSVTYTASLSGEYSVLITNSYYCTVISNTLSLTVHPLPIPTIIGSSDICTGSDATYTTEPGLTNYAWSTSAGGTITAGAGTNSIMVVWNTSGMQWVEVNYADANGCETSNPTAFLVNVSDTRTLNLTLFLEGLYAGTGMMRQAQNADGPQFSGGIADQLTTELYNSELPHALAGGPYSVDINTNGTASVNIPCTLNTSYFVVVRHRNSIGICTSSPVSFSGSVIDYDFSTGSGQAYGDNQKLISGKYVLFAGDVNQDGMIDNLDRNAIWNQASAFGKGYIPEDLNGDGNIDAYDIIMCDNNAAIFISSRLPFVLPTVSTAPVQNIAQTTAISGGNVTSHGGTEVTARGICWAATSNPTIAGSHTTDGKGTGAFISYLIGLTANTLYYVRSYATNNDGTGYGNEFSFTTLSAPVFTCGDSITKSHIPSGGVAPVDKVVTYGTVTNIPGEPSKCWITQNLGATKQASTVDDASEASAGWYWQFDLRQGYKHDGITRTPATTWIDNIYEDSDWISTNDPCTLELGWGWRIPTSTEWTNVIAGGNWTNADGPWNSGLKLHLAGALNQSNGSLYFRNYAGLYWGSSQEFAAAGYCLRFTGPSLYWMRDSKANGYSIRCLKDPGSTTAIPMVSTAPVYNIAQFIATGGGNITSDGGSSVTARGVCWSLSNNPTTDSGHTTDGSGTGTFVSNLTGLSANTLYYTRAYASNSVGTAYGEEFSFTTLVASIFPTVTTTVVTNVGTNTASSGGNVTDDGGLFLITARGVCYATSANPTLSDSFTENGAGTGSFTSMLTGLVSGDTYYLRAYASNSEVTSYGEEIVFTALQPCQSLSSFTVNHTTYGGVAPVDKTVTYSTVTNMPGEPTKCWITQNLGATNQAVSVGDDTEAAAGWYWQFNLRQGYKHDGTTRTPATTWIDNIYDDSDWTSANDPCTLELGTSWHIPTATEWNNMIAGGYWTDYNGPWNSGLKLHFAGALDGFDGSLHQRNYAGYYWGSSQEFAAAGFNLQFSGSWFIWNSNQKSYGYSIRCLKD